MLTLIDYADRTYSLIFGPKIRLVKNCRVRKVTNISVAKFVGRSLAQGLGIPADSRDRVAAAAAAAEIARGAARRCGARRVRL
jgi:hypothetical protein